MNKTKFNSDLDAVNAKYERRRERALAGIEEINTTLITMNAEQAAEVNALVEANELAEKNKKSKTA